ncbi:MAG: rhodanese-like domain-containing protein [Sphaerochaeta sp.]|nr:rhodanese-like domain-containing protein [Sphaerochaeta sp.]
MKKRLSIVLLILLSITLVFTSCGKKAAAPAAVAPAATVAPAPAPAAPAKVAVDADAVLLAAAKEYFPALATSNNMISAKDLKALLDDNPDALVLVDIRSGADFEAGHIEGAYHSAWADLGAVMEKIPTNRQVVIVCYSGQTASQAGGALRLAGFSNVKILTGGMNGWKSAGFEAAETGARPMSSRSNVSSPKGDEQQVLWDAAKAYFKSVGTDGNKMVTAQNLYDALETNPRAFKVIDIRGESDFAEGHIQGATHSAWAQFASVIPSLSKSEKILIACFSGQTSGQTVGVLRAMGYDAYSLQGGMNNGWKPANLPLVQ